MVQWQDSLEAIGKMVAEQEKYIEAKISIAKRCGIHGGISTRECLEKMLKDYESQLAISGKLSVAF